MTTLSSGVLLDLYACAEHPQRWGAMLDRICRDLNARSGVAQVFHEEDEHLHTGWEARDSFSLAHAALHDAVVNNDRNPRLNLRVSAPLGSRLIIRDRDMFPPDCPHWNGLQQRLASIGLGQSIGINLPLTAASSFSVILHRAENDRRPFTDGEEQYLRDLAPHLDQMLRQSRARAETTADCAFTREALESLHVGVALCDGDRRLHWLNSAAEDILRRSPYLTTTGGMLRAVRSEDDRGIQTLLCSAATQSGADVRRMLSLGGMEADAVQCLAVPLRPSRQDVWSGAVATTRIAVFLSRPHAPRAFSTADISALYGLSPSEAALAVALCQGHTINEHAQNRSISVGTARIQLKQAMAKMDAHRQADLVLQICGSVVGHTTTRLQ